MVHVPVEALVKGATGEVTELAGELESNGLISAEVVHEIACGATIAVAVDDDVGHTMYEGRAKRFPTGAQRREVRRRDRHCRFPGCTNVTFADVHHVVAWNHHGGTDLDNLALLCRYHHGVVHRRGWSMTGNANEELTIVGPTGRVIGVAPIAAVDKGDRWMAHGRSCRGGRRGLNDRPNRGVHLCVDLSSGAGR